jgi:periplasmic protein TonB
MSYIEQKRAQKPVSMAAAIAFNGAIIAAVMLSPMVAGPTSKPPITEATNVFTPKPPPPDRVKDVKDDPKPLLPVYVPKPPFDPPVISDPIRTTQDPTVTNPGFVDGKGAGNDGDFGPKIQDPPKPPLPPVFKRAVRDPRFASAFQPSYPSNLIVRGVEGSATIRVLVGTDGRVREANVVSATHPDFGKAALRQALKAWRFKPATRGGEPVEDWVTLPVTFVIT